MERLIKYFTIVIVTVALSLVTGCNRHTANGDVRRTLALNAGAWNVSQWISVVDAPVVTGPVKDTENNRAADGASWFQTIVRNDAKVVRATWMTTGLGVYDLFVNGQPIGEEILKPGFTHPFKTRRSFTYDITAVFNKKAGKENVLAAQVTPGWWADKIVTPWGHEGMVGKKCAFRSVLELTFADGSKKCYGTDTDNWRAGIAGRVKHAGIFDGEAYDARETEDCLRGTIPKHGQSTDGLLSKPEKSNEFQGEILPTDGGEVYLRTDLALSPVNAYTWKDVEGARDGEYGKIVIAETFPSCKDIKVRAGETLVVDFGQNCAAVPSFVFKVEGTSDVEGEKHHSNIAHPTSITCLPGELLNDGNGAKSRGMDGPEGSVHRDNLRIPNTGIRLDYTFADNGDYETFCPRNTFFGYRYLSITTTADIVIKSIQSIPVTSIARNLETGVITTGNDLINRLIANTVWGMRSNYLSVPTDCPQRNERLGWTADTQVFTATGTFFANTDRFFHKWMRDMRDSQSEQGGFPGVAPLAQYGGEMMRVGWADAGIIVPWTIWKQYGDTAIIHENWAAMLRFIAHINETKYDHNALIAENGNYQWADWLSYEPLESCGGGAFKDGKPLPDAVAYWNYLNASYWAIDAAMMADMAHATNNDQGVFEEMYANAIAYLKETFLNADGTFKTAILNTMQTPALFALKNHLVEGEAKANMIARLRKNFADHGNCLQTGFLGTSILMQTLTDNGMADIAYELLFQRKNPSWLYSIDNGATTIWERWNSYTRDKGLGPQGMNSFNHYAYGAVCQWLWESVAGIAADSAIPGFRRIIMRPIPDKRLGYVDAEYQSAAGLIKSSWRYDGNLWIWKFTIPEGTTAVVTLPNETSSKEYEAGTYEVRKTMEELNRTYYYRNPVIDKSLPDPTIVRTKDGDFYLYATENTPNVPIYRSKNLTDWTFVGTAFTDESRPQWNSQGRIWAPDINYINEKYVLYYAKSTWGGEWDCGIGVATADNPEGPFHDHGCLFISKELNTQNSIDPDFVEENGRKYLFWGSFRGIWYIELSDDGLSLKEGAMPSLVSGTFMEAVYIHRRNGYYYMFGSSGSCCDGEKSTYHVTVGRSKSLFGPYLDRQGRPLLENHYETVLHRSDRCIGPGHNAEIITDNRGTDWIVYHGFKADAPEDGRVVWLDKIEWDSGWPHIANSQPSIASESPIFYK